MISRLVAAVLLLWMLGFAWFAVSLPGPADDQMTDGIVVLTGGRGRIERGLDLIRAKRAKRMLISGVDRQVKPHELAAEYHAPLSLFDCCVDLGHEAVDTRSNAQETANWVRRYKYRSIRLVTTDWHMARARYELARMLDGEVVIVRDAVPSEPGLLALLTEYNKYVLRRVSGQMGI
ncbi:YdcF family protein [Flavisphingomonas formosensis]|uniref:YdcF family protein n=1 Tax=Flavisphingomonas formosensis TaxID=861534 RepID=UPI0012FAED14|nr:YdcF family protein [Sphingomonas formosensis]